MSETMSNRSMGRSPAAPQPWHVGTAQVSVSPRSPDCSGRNPRTEGFGQWTQNWPMVTAQHGEVTRDYQGFVRFWPPLRNFEIGWASDGWSSEDFGRKYKWLMLSFKISISLAVLILDHGWCHASAPGRWCSELYGAEPTWTEHGELGFTSDKIRIIWCNVVDNYW